MKQCIELEALAHNAAIPTISAVIHSYRFSIDTTEGLTAYRLLRERIKAQSGAVKFASVSAGQFNWYKRIAEQDGETIQLQTDYLFSNQWNTACGKRLMDWAEAVYSNRNVKEGYWLELPPEAAQLRAEWTSCHNCGKQSRLEEVEGGACPKCSSTEHLINLTSGQSFDFYKLGEIEK
jgi:hypothetical protein